MASCWKRTNSSPPKAGDCAAVGELNAGKSFVANKRQVFCGAPCSQQERTERFVAKHSSRELSERRHPRPPDQLYIAVVDSAVAKESPVLIALSRFGLRDRFVEIGSAPPTITRKR